MAVVSSNYAQLGNTSSIVFSFDPFKPGVSLNHLAWTVSLLDAGSEDNNGNPQIVGYEVRNKDGLFCKCVTGLYGNPVIYQEPKLGIPIPDEKRPYWRNRNGTDIVTGSMARVVGFCTVEGKQWSLSNLKMKSINYQIDHEFSRVTIGDEEWFIVGYHCPDQNRLIGLVAILGRKPPKGKPEVTDLGSIIEMAYKKE